MDKGNSGKVDLNEEKSIFNYSYAAFVGGGDGLSVGAEGFADHAVALQGALRTGSELLVGELDVDAAAGDVDDDDVAVHDLTDIAAAGCLGRDMADAEAAGAAGEAAVGDEGALLTHVHTLDIGGGIEHLLHTGAALGAFVGDDDAVALLDLAAKDALAGVLLAVEDDGRTFEVPQLGGYASGLHDAAVLRDVAEEHGHAAVLRVGVFNVADATIGAVGVEGLVVRVLRAHASGELACRRAAVDIPRRHGAIGDLTIGRFTI